LVSKTSTQHINLSATITRVATSLKQELPREEYSDIALMQCPVVSLN